MIGVQNIVTPGSSGGPLISIDDEDGRFMGLGVRSPTSRLISSH